MRKNMAVISAFILGVSCCSPEMLVMAVQNEKETAGAENILKENSTGKNYLFGKNLAAGMNEMDQILPESSQNLLGVVQDADMESNIDLFDFGNLELSKGDFSLLKEDEDGSNYVPLENKEKDSATDEIDKNVKEILENEEDADKKDQVAKTSEMKDLQIPQKLEVVIDPWEMDGKGQIYSEEYIIKNTGKTTGILTLSRLTCKPQEKSSVVVRMDKDDLYDNGDKFVYMEMIFGNGGQVVLSEIGSEYQAELKPGEELSFQFIGEVNEYAEDKWTNEDVEVDVVYSWNVENETDSMDDQNMDEVVADKDEADTEKNAAEGTNDVNEKNTAESAGGIDKKDAVENKDNVSENETIESIDSVDGKNDIENEVSAIGDTEKKEFGAVREEDDINNDSQAAADIGNDEKDDEESLPKIEEFSYEQGGDENKDGKVEIIDLKKMQKSRLLINSWTIDGEIQDAKEIQENQGVRITSTEYVMRNTGETTGILTLTGLKCKPQEQSGIIIMKTQEELHNSVGETGYVEMRAKVEEDEEKKSISQEDSEYQVELKPREEIVIRFAGEVKGSLAENQKNDGIEVTAICLWNSKIETERF